MKTTFSVNTQMSDLVKSYAKEKSITICDALTVIISQFFKKDLIHNKLSVYGDDFEIEGFLYTATKKTIKMSSLVGINVDGKVQHSADNNGAANITFISFEPVDLSAIKELKRLNPKLIFTLRTKKEVKNKYEIAISV